MLSYTYITALLLLVLCTGTNIWTWQHDVNHANYSNRRGRLSRAMLISSFVIVLMYVARYGLFVLKLPLNPTNQITNEPSWCTQRNVSLQCIEPATEQLDVIVSFFSWTDNNNINININAAGNVVSILPRHNEHRIRSRCSRCLTFCLVFTPAALCSFAKK